MLKSLSENLSKLALNRKSSSDSSAVSESTEVINSWKNLGRESRDAFQYLLKENQNSTHFA